MKKLLLVVSFVFIFSPIIIFGSMKIKDEINFNKKEKQEKELVSKIKSYYSEYVETIKETKLYKNVNSKYEEYGNISKGVKLKLKEEDINSKTKYFHIDGLDLYIKYDSVKKIDKFNKNERYKYYIAFNKNIKTNNSTSFYNSDKELLYTLNDSIDLPILVLDDEYSGVVYNDELLYIKNSDGTIYRKENNSSNKSKIRVLTYHFLYDEKSEKCDQEICYTLTQFEENAKYLRENEYFTMKLDELELYLDGKINIPEKSIVLTIDDGTIFNLKVIDILEKYKVNLTMFVITGIVKADDKKSEYLDLESHTDNMHNQYECPGYGMQGGGILCLPEEKVLSDLKKSQEKLGGSKYFAYPFFDFNDRAIQLLKKAGFNMAFIGQYDSDGYSYPNRTNKYLVRRKTVFSDLTEKEFIEYIS